MMNISVIGAGYVGLISGIGFAKLNNKVSIIDETQCIGRYATPIIIGEEVE